MVRVSGFVPGCGDTRTDAEDALTRRRYCRAHFDVCRIRTIRRSRAARMAVATILYRSTRRFAAGLGRHNLSVDGGKNLLAGQRDWKPELAVPGP